MHLRQPGCSQERWQEPGPQNAVVDHEAQFSQFACSSPSGLEDDAVLAARRGQPGQDVSLLHHCEEDVTGDERARREPVRQLLRH